MDVYEQAMYYAGMMECMQPELSRVERAKRVLMVLEMDVKEQRVSQSLSQVPAIAMPAASNKRDSFNRLVTQSPDMSTYQLASAIGISQSTASRWKRKVKRF